MTIETNNLKLLESERIRTDADDGGGKYSGREIVDGQSNNLFNDISEMDRTTGRVSIQKIYAAVDTADTDALMGATVFISQNAQDPNVSAVLFSTDSWTDERSSAQNRIENYLAKGAQIAGAPLDTQWQGMKSIQVAMHSTEVEASIGETLVLAYNEGMSSQREQYVRITEVSTREAFVMIGNTKNEYKIATYMINDALESDFVGLSAEQWYVGAKSPTIIRETIVADTGKYYSSVWLQESVSVGEYSVLAKSIYAQLVPSSQTETPIIDIDAAGNTIGLVKAAGSITKQYNITVNTLQSLYIGSSILPGSVSFTLFGSAVTDVGGELKNSTGTYIGTIDYQNGHIQWNTSAGTGTTSITMSFTPASKVAAPIESDLIQVLPSNNGYNWVRNLLPLPTRGSLQVSYIAQGRVYTLRDTGSGQLKGSDPAFGVGSINYENGTLSFTTGALPDVYSGILITWATTIVIQERSDITISKAYVQIKAGESIDPNTDITITWLLDNTLKTATIRGSNITGDATGAIDHAGGVIRLMPSLLPNRATTYSISGKVEKGYKVTGSVSASPLNGSVRFFLDVGSSPIIPNTFSVRVPIKFEGYSGEIDLFDRDGQLVTAAGNRQGSINHATGEVNITPSKAFSFVERVEIVTPYYGTRNTNKEALEHGYKGLQIKYNNVTRNETLSLDNVLASVSIAFSYRNTSDIQTLIKSQTFDTLKMDLSDGYPEQFLSESVRFTLGGSTYVDRMGVLQRNPELTTGVGIVAGQIHYGTGAVELTAWEKGASNTAAVESLVVRLGNVDSNQVSFRAPIVPLRAQSLSLAATTTSGQNLTITPDIDGDIDTAECQGFFNFEQGYGQFVFREKILITEENRPTIMAASWYNAEGEYTIEGRTYIHKPIHILPETLRYSAVAYSYMPISADILGLSATRLPSDGRVPIFRSGEIGIVSASKSQELPDYIAGQTYPLNDARISWCELEDADGIKIPFDMYVVDYDYGKVTLNGDFALGNLTGPLTAKYRYQDMGLVRDVKINGQVTFTKPLTHNYDPAHTIVGSALVIGDMQGRYTRKFVQSTWDNLWKDEAVGAAISANYNDTLYPIAVTNKGNIQERWAIVFTGNTSFRIIGETSGQIGTGVTTEDCSPINPVTNAPYFTIKKEGWGNGWASGNVLRFNTIASNHPIWVIRTVKQSEPTVLSDSFQIMLRGDIDRVA